MGGGEGRQAYALTAWIRGDALAATSLRTHLFHDAIPAALLGLVLNVVDRGHDGWAGGLMRRTGYERFSIDSTEFTSDGFDVEERDTAPAAERMDRT